jgi:pilus assembly protein Flp/PilA
MKQVLKAFVADESGVTALEYGLIAALTSVVIITALSAVGEELNRTFTMIAEALDRANSKAP